MTTGTLKATVNEGLEKVAELARAHHEHGRLKLAQDLNIFYCATIEYIRILENSVRAARVTIKALNDLRD